METCVLRMPLVRIRNLVRAAAAARGPILMVTLCCYAFVILEALSCSCVIQREFTQFVVNAPSVAELRAFFNVVVALIVTVTSSAVAVGDLFGRGRSGRRTGSKGRSCGRCGSSRSMSRGIGRGRSRIMSRRFRRRVARRGRGRASRRVLGWRMGWCVSRGRGRCASWAPGR